MSNWQPIETAPKDPRSEAPSILAYCPFHGGSWRICCVRWGKLTAEGDNFGWHADIHSFVPLEPTHWMPLPKPPKDATP